MSKSLKARIKRKFKKLHLTDRFLFQHSFRKIRYIKAIIEGLLHIKVKKIKFIGDEVTFSNNIRSKDIRCDIIVKDAKNTIYNIEMENRDKHIHERREYYSSMLAVDSVRKGGAYTDLAHRKIIIITNFDPFDKNTVVYTLREKCEEYPDIDTKSRTETVYLNLKGKVGYEKLSPVIKDFIRLATNTTKETADTLDTKVIRDLFEQVQYIKTDQKKEKMYMGWILDYQDDMRASAIKGEKRGKKAGMALAVDILDLFREGLNINEIAAKTGASIDYIMQLLGKKA